MTQAVPPTLLRTTYTNAMDEPERAFFSHASGASESTPGSTAPDPWTSAADGYDPSAGSGYITSGELLAWLSVVGGNTYDDMRKQMMGTEQRRELQEDLSTLKSLVEETQSTKDLDKLEAKIGELIAKYEGTPLEARVDELLGGRSQALAGVRSAQQVATEATAQPVVSDTPDVASGSNPQTVQLQKDASKARDAILDQLPSFSTDLQAKVDHLGGEDQLALIKIQELNSQITQTTQLASNLLASQDQAQSAAIMNLKG